MPGCADPSKIVRLSAPQNAPMRMMLCDCFSTNAARDERRIRRRGTTAPSRARTIRLTKISTSTTSISVLLLTLASGFQNWRGRPSDKTSCFSFQRSVSALIRSSGARSWLAPSLVCLGRCLPSQIRVAQPPTLCGVPSVDVVLFGCCMVNVGCSVTPHSMHHCGALSPPRRVG